MPEEQIPLTPAITSIFSSSRRQENLEFRSQLHQSEAKNVDSLEIDFTLNTARFQFTSFDYSNDPGIELFYKIDGLVDQWTSVGNENELIFPSLPSGSFDFRLRAQNLSAELTSPESSIAFTILPPFWKTNTFKAGMVLVIVLAIALLVRQRTQYISSINRKLEALVADRTLALEKSKEEALRARDEAERANKAKSDFLASVSHEIRTPMNGVIGMNHMLVEANLEPELNEYARAGGRSAESMLALINDILDISKIEAGKFVLENEPFNIQSTVEDAIELFTVEAQEKGVDLRSFPDSNLPTIMTGDPLRVKQAVMNLVSNAVKFTENGSVSVYLRLLSKNENTAVFECAVKDTGIGIPEKAWPRLFDAFTQADSSTTRKFGGTGLGLSITKNLVKAMNGVVEFRSEEGSGSEFRITFELEIADPDTVVPNQQSDDRLSQIATQIALPDLEIQEWLQNWLRTNDIPTTANSDSKRILEILDNDLSCLIIDKQIISPDIARAIKAAKNRANIYIILVQNFTDSFRHTELESEIVDDFASYPIRPNYIIKLLKKGLTIAKGDSPSIESNALPPNEYSDSHMLLVDDNRMNQEVLKALLSKTGAQIDEATNGKEAIVMSSISRYDLIFMDCRMPEIDGYEATQAIRNHTGSQNKHTPIIALTANDMEGDREKCINAGMNDYLTKPILPESLSNVLVTWIRRESSKSRLRSSEKS